MGNVKKELFFERHPRAVALKRGPLCDSPLGPLHKSYTGITCAESARCISASLFVEKQEFSLLLLLYSLSICLSTISTIEKRMALFSLDQLRPLLHKCSNDFSIIFKSSRKKSRKILNSGCSLSLFFCLSITHRCFSTKLCRQCITTAFLCRLRYSVIGRS